VVQAEGIVAIHPEGFSAAEGKQGAPSPKRTPHV
jgi:hypothetical protein